jgi:AraC-like DNA-binding protein
MIREPRVSSAVQRSLMRLCNDKFGVPDIAELATLADLSLRYFQRRFVAEMGLTAGQYARTRRLQRASYRLLYRPFWSVIDIALDAGYASPEAFARAFRRWFGQSPTAFREAPDWAAWSRACISIDPEGAMYPTRPPDVSVVQTEQRWVAALTYRGAPAAFSDTLRRFTAWRRAERRSPRVSATINLFHDDGEEASDDRIHITLCAETPKPVTPTPDGLRPLRGAMRPGFCESGCLPVANRGPIFRSMSSGSHSFQTLQKKMRKPLYISCSKTRAAMRGRLCEKWQRQI